MRGGIPSLPPDVFLAWTGTVLLELIFNHSLIHLVVSIVTSLYTLPKRILHKIRFSDASFNFQIPLFFFFGKFIG